jgi:spore coat protein JB
MMNPRNQTANMGKCKGDLQMLRALDFAIQETVLYLDAYPENKQALAYYHKLIRERGELMAIYEKNCGPLSIYGNTNHGSWDWVEGPWPWEPDAN